MSKSKSAHASFETQQTTTTTPPPPPPPPPPAKAGHYTGTYTDGTYITFDVDSLGASATNFRFDLNGHCDGGGTSYGNLFANGPFQIQGDGSFTGAASFSLSNGNVTVNLAGKFTPTGSASGTLSIGLAFSDGVNCTSTGTWTAQDQS